MGGHWLLQGSWTWALLYSFAQQSLAEGSSKSQALLRPLLVFLLLGLELRAFT
jgi:hypothetical protein